MNKQRWKEIIQEVEALCAIHARISQSAECREFNSRSARLLQRLEDEGCDLLADKMMNLLAYCSPKDLSQCDSVQRARDALERLRDVARENLEKYKG